MRAALVIALFPGFAIADTVVATRTLRAESVIGPADVTMVAGDVAGSLDDSLLAVGMETRVTLYAGRPVLAADLGAPAIIDRNQLVALSYRNGALMIVTEGRALGRGGVGDVIRVMNLQSRATVTGRIAEDGQVVVGPQL
ncbi:flagellar basal body P-ring formation chaperone FlgA [Falsirhodobacter sp. alg1]|uniref:flagellar basal body P-ring formation chaperone FlgA n=1 Tax=Falsirhodobacter sp. alg1 TaxID=1472418 RepID=UPI0005EDF269